MVDGGEEGGEERAGDVDILTWVDFDSILSV